MRKKKRSKYWSQPNGVIRVGTRAADDILKDALVPRRSRPGGPCCPADGALIRVYAAFPVCLEQDS